MKVVMQPGGAERMSDVLESFVEPYADQAATIETYRKLLSLGIVAWNAALFPEPKRTAMIDDILRRGLRERSGDLEDELRDIVQLLIARKEACFAENRRTILDFELNDLGGEWYLNVASILDGDSRS